jgi:crossover junction endodeoxyribonuclease RusA
VTAGQWTLELPFTTPLSLNDRESYWARAARTKVWRDAANVLARQQRIPRCARIYVQLTYTPRDVRRRDALNLVPSLKACEDGLVDAHVIPDDSTAYHTSLMPLITAKGPSRPHGNRLWLVITAAQA